MRTDTELAGGSIRASDEWQRDTIGGDGEMRPEMDSRLHAGDEIIDGKMVVHSLSGKERNRLFLNREAGHEFTDISAVSGLDSVSDGRGFTVFDYDRDGWQDIALINANQPLMQLFHNDIGRLGQAKGGMIAIRFVGGSQTSGASELCNRDGYGAIVEVQLDGGETVLKREHRCGTGYAAQNSATMIVGIGSREAVDSLQVRWPSGKLTRLETVTEGKLITAYESRAAGDFELEDYRRATSSPAQITAKERFPAAREAAAGLHVYTTTATWCAACKAHLPRLQRLAQDKGVAFFGVPLDPADDAGKLGAYVEENKPAYQMMSEMTIPERASVEEFLKREMATENVPLPSTVITSGDGMVLQVMTGLPSVSDLRRLLTETTGSR